MPDLHWQRHRIVEYLLGLPSWCHEHVEPALSGDAESALRLICAAPNPNRGDVVKALWKYGAPADALRAALQGAWVHDHAEVWRSFGRSLPKVFKAAKFPIDHLPERLTVWRGGNGDRVTVRSGISWTLSRDCACWFAMRRDTSTSVVLRRTVLRRNVLAHITARDEDEIVVWNVAPIEVDGCPDEWRAAHARCQRARNGHQNGHN